jgi:type I restriction enzyme S subunit
MINPNWPKQKLSSLSSRIGDGIHGTPIYTDNSEYSFINGNNLKNGYIQISNETKKVSVTEFNKYFIMFDNETLFLSINGTLGSLAKYRGEPVILGKSAAYIKCTSINIDYLYYYLQLDSIQDYLWNVATGSTIKNLSLASIRNLEIPTPPAEIQQKIAGVLSTIDAKIHCNNQINTELESMAKTLYDYWFVQFEFPDNNQKPYKSSGGAMVYNKTLKREIPESWSVVQLNMLLKSQTDSISSSDLDINDIYTPIDSLPMKKMSFGFGRPSSEANSSLIRYKSNDILIGAMRVYFHRVCIAPFNGITRTTTLVLRPFEPRYFPYLYQVCNEDLTISVATNISVGTQQPYVNWENSLENHVIPYPNSNKLVEEYSVKMTSIFQEVINREKENAELIKLRNWLLPMLMNGQVTVSQ